MKNNYYHKLYNGEGYAKKYMGSRYKKLFEVGDK